MRVTRQDVPQQPKQQTGRRLPEPSPAAWSVVAIAGAAGAVFAAGPTLEAFIVAVSGVMALGIAQHRLGFLDARRHADPRVAELARERDHWRGIAEYLGRLAVQPPVAGPGEGDGGGGEPPAPAAARPSAGVRGGGRPGAVGSVAAATLDAPLPGETAGVTE